jgi:lipopolysaccharide export LptBFGC system permease protein LptF
MGDDRRAQPKSCDTDMVFTIHRYIFRDLVKTFCLATLVLSLVLGLGVMLRPLRQFGVDPARVPELLLYTFPITLTLVIPIAALLSAPLNYGRLAVDNEINACRSSGIGLLTLIYPALALALLVGLATLLLGFHVIPAYAQKFESIIKTDAESIVFRNIAKGGDLSDIFPDMKVRIHADEVNAREHRLSGVAVVKMDRRGVEEIITAQAVDVLFQEGSQKNQVMLRLHNAKRLDNFTTASLGEFELFLPVPSLWKDNIKFKKLGELKAIQNDMTIFGPIQDLLQDIRRQVLMEKFFEWCRQQLQRPEHVVDLTYQQHRLRVRAASCTLPDGKSANKANFVVLGGKAEWPVSVDYYYRTTDKEPEKRYRAKTARLVMHPSESTAVLHLENVRWTFATEERDTNLTIYDFPGIVIPGEIVAATDAMSLESVLGDPIPLKESNNATSYLSGLYARFRRVCQEVHITIDLELQARLAFGVSCVALVLFGAALGIVFRSGHLLTAFGISVLPAALCLITIFTGKHIAERSTLSAVGGFVFLWSGIAIVSLADLIIYKFLLKR